MALDTLTPSAMLAGIEMSRAFRTWSGTANIIDHNDLDEALFDHLRMNAGEPIVLRVFHGTTHAFERFDLSQHAYTGGFLGRVHYFTTSYHDAKVNYACVGPDLSGRIEEQIERKTDDVLEDLTAFGLGEDADREAAEDTAKKIVKAELIGDHHHVKTCHLRLTNPFVVRDNKYMPDQTPLFLPQIEDAYDTARTEVLEAHGLDPEDHDLDLDCEIEDEIYETYDLAIAETIEEVRAALTRACDAVGCDPVALPDTLLENICELSHARAWKLLKESEELAYIEHRETGEYLQGDLLARFLHEMGFDALVLLDAHVQFCSMEMEPGTAHVHILSDDTDQIRIALNGDELAWTECFASETGDLPLAA